MVVAWCYDNESVCGGRLQEAVQAELLRAAVRKHCGTDTVYL